MQSYTASTQGNHSNSKHSVMLLPTKVAEIQGVIHSNDVGIHDGVESFVPLPHGSLSRWTAQPVLKWIESLASATTMGSPFDDSEIISDATVKVLNDLSDPTPAIVVGNDHTLDQKRSSTPPLLDEISDHMTCQWDLSFVDQHDPYAYIRARKMKHLAGTFERMMTTVKTPKKLQDMSLAYQMVQSRFTFTFDRIVWQNLNHHPTTHTTDGLSSELSNGYFDRGDAENRLLLDALYEEICQKLQNITSAFDKSSKGFGSIQGPTAVVSQPNCVTVQGSKSMKKHQTKQELGKYMTSWLRENFTNPYPDDEGLVHMANHCGTTNQVISNWLINARTRKWRPAIIKATELGRPADMLLEDSINIFDGKSVRPIAMHHNALITDMNTAYTTPSHPAMITPIYPDVSGSLNPFHKSVHGSTMKIEGRMERAPVAKRQKRLHVVTTTSTFPKASRQLTTNHHHGSRPSAPKAFQGNKAAEMNTSNAPKLIFDDEDDDGILLQSIQNAIDMESMSDGTIKFDTNFFSSINAADEDTIDVAALSPTFFNITNLHQALSQHYKF